MPYTSREKVLRAINRQGPAPFPKHLRPCPALAAHFSKLAGGQDLDAWFGLDLRWLYCGRPEGFDFAAELTDAEFDRAFDFQGVMRQADALREAGVAVVSGYECGTFEQAHEIRGIEQLLSDVLLDPEGTLAFLDRIARNKARIAAAYARSGVDIVFIGDDMGSQRSLLVSRDTWQRFFRPPLERIVAAIRESNGEVRIAYHSCGCIEPLVPDLVAVGIDILESLQPECNSVSALIADHSDHLAFWGAIGAQSTMARGTPSEVRQAVLDLTSLFGRGSGLIVAPAHTLEPDTPAENITAFLEAVAEADARAEAGATCAE